jgi:hypothetical protein
MLCIFIRFSLLPRVDYIGRVDKLTGKVELRFYINEIDKTVIKIFFYKMN